MNKITETEKYSDKAVNSAGMKEYEFNSDNNLDFDDDDDSRDKDFIATNYSSESSAESEEYNNISDEDDNLFRKNKIFNSSTRSEKNSNNKTPQPLSEKIKVLIAIFNFYIQQ